MIDSYFDMNSISHPVKTFLTQEYFYPVQANFVHQAEIFLTKNELARSDDYFMLIEDNSPGILPHNKTILSSMKPLSTHRKLTSSRKQPDS